MVDFSSLKINEWLNLERPKLRKSLRNSEDKVSKFIYIEGQM